MGFTASRSATSRARFTSLVRNLYMGIRFGLALILSRECA